MMNLTTKVGIVMLSAAKHLGAQRERPFAEFTLSASEWAASEIADIAFMTNLCCPFKRAFKYGSIPMNRYLQLSAQE